MENDFEFETYLKGKLTHRQFEEGLRELFGTPHRRTKALNMPSSITHAELLKLSKFLDVSAHTLYTSFGVGSGALEKLEVEMLEFVHLKAGGRAIAA
jgi:hypothetical protein